MKLLLIACNNFYINKKAFLKGMPMNKNKLQPPQPAGKYKYWPLGPGFKILPVLISWNTGCLLTSGQDVSEVFVSTVNMDTEGKGSKFLEIVRDSPSSPHPT